MKNINKYQELATRTAPQRRDNYMNFTLGIAGEAGEIVDYIKKVAFQGHALDKDKVSYEIGDLLWYIVNLAKELDLDISKILDMNIEKLERRYPKGFEANRSINRED